MNVALIPVRGGSKSIPLKNIKPICGKPLVYWTVKAACESGRVDKVYVATDDERISKVVEEFKKSGGCYGKVSVIGRSPETASDTASTESVMLEFATKFEFDNVVLVQATSPLLEAADIDRGFEVFAGEGVDSVLSVVRQKRFNWSLDEMCNAHPSNYDVYNRPRRQEFDGYLVENGAFYITSKKGLIESKNRVSGNIRTVEMDEDTFFEIDEPSDWIIIEALMKKRGRDKEGAIPKIKMFLTDCDGCLTDGGMYYSENGDELKKFNTRDGMGMRLLRENGILTGIVTGEDVKLNRRRADKLKLDIYESGCLDKLAFVKRICSEQNIDIENVAYVGDDINDLELIQAVGYGCAPSDAAKSVKAYADYVATAKGGHGAVREVIDRILECQKND